MAMKEKEVQLGHLAAFAALKAPGPVQYYSPAKMKSDQKRKLCLEDWFDVLPRPVKPQKRA